MTANAKVHILFLMAMACPTAMAWAQDVFSSKNVAYWYDIHGDITIGHKTIFKPDSTIIFIGISLKEGEKLAGNYSLYYAVTKGYDNLPDKFSDSLTIQNHLLGQEGNHYYMRFGIPKNDDDRLVALELVQKPSGRAYYYDINMDEKANYSNDGLILMDGNSGLPIIKSYVNIGANLKIQSETRASANIFGYYYEHDFEEAIPPMITDERPVGKSLTVDSTFTINAGQPLILKKQGLYFFQTDTSSLNGVAIRVQNDYYPLTRTLSELLPPLIYISTSDETKAIRNAQNPREAFEKYWLGLSPTENKAKESIKKYYDRVDGANYFFTSYKEGWKTDMGMIYIVYGKPDEVYKNEETMDWVYNRDITLPIIRFSFVKVKNIFSDDFYTLLRKKNYDRHWFRSVELWREGKK